MKNKDKENISKIYSENIVTNNANTLRSKVEDVLDWLLTMETFEDAEDACGYELDYIGDGRHAKAYYHNGVIIKIVEDGDISDWEDFIKLDCFAQTEILESNFGLIILQEELTLNASEYENQDVQQKIENCLNAAGIEYDQREVTDENVGLDGQGNWKLFDLPF